MRIFRCLAIIVAFLSAAACASKLGPKVRLTAGPKILPASVINPPNLYLRVTIRDMNEEFWCPQVRWIWPGGLSEEQGDCDPYNPADTYQRKWSATKTVSVSSFSGGEWIVGVQLVKAGRVLWFDAVTITLAGTKN